MLTNQPAFRKNVTEVILWKAANISSISGTRLFLRYDRSNTDTPIAETRLSGRDRNFI